MRVFVYEFAGVLGARAPASLRAEGRAMLTAIVRDFARMDGVHVTTLLHEDFGEPLGDECQRISPEHEESAFRATARRADFTLVIAPETGGVLAERSRWVLAAGGSLLGSSPAAVELAADKLALGDLLIQSAIHSPRAVLAGATAAAALDFPLVCKPRDGAGSQATVLVRSRAELDRALAQARAELPEADFVLQPFVAGIAASVAFINGDTATMTLPPCRQLLSKDGRFHYLGGECPLPGGLALRAQRLARRALRVVPDLRGYVGVDLVLGVADDGSGDCIIEINPRLTTSYIGLRELARGNLAEAMLATATCGAIPDMPWKPARVRFTAAGGIHIKGEPGI